MAWLTVDKNGEETIYEEAPIRDDGFWDPSFHDPSFVELPKGSIAKLIGRELTWEDEPVELK